MRHDVKWNDPVFKLAIKMLTRQQWLDSLDTLIDSDFYILQGKECRKLTRWAFLKKYVNDRYSTRIAMVEENGIKFIMVYFNLNLSDGSIIDVCRVNIKTQHTYEDYLSIISSNKEKKILTDILSTDNNNPIARSSRL